MRKLATAVTEELLEKTFSQFGKLERVKKLKDYAFVHFEERDAAVKVNIGTHTLLLSLTQSHTYKKMRTFVSASRPYSIILLRVRKMVH